MRPPVITILLVIQVVLGQEKKLSINVTSDNQFTISVSGKEWFHSGPVKARNGGQWLSSEDGSLILGDTYTHSSEDRLGTYDYYRFNYHDSSKEFSFTTFIKAYDNGQAIVFGHTFDSGAEKAAVGSSDEVISSYPSIPLEDSSLERGYLVFEGGSK